MNEIETRGFENAEVRTVPGSPNTVRWLPITFGQLSADLGGFQERIEPGSVTKTLREGNPTADWQHDNGVILGTLKARTLRLNPDQRGVWAEVDLPESAVAVREAVARGDASGGSFTFSVVKEAWQRGGALPVRVVQEMRLSGVSLLASQPAYPATLNTVSSRAVVEARSLAAGLPRGPQTAADRRAFLNSLDPDRDELAKLRSELAEVRSRLTEPAPRKFWIFPRSAR